MPLLPIGFKKSGRFRTHIKVWSKRLSQLLVILPAIFLGILIIVLIFHPNDARLPASLPIIESTEISEPSLAAPSGALSRMSSLASSLALSLSLLHGDLPAVVTPSESQAVAEKFIWAKNILPNQVPLDVRILATSARFRSPLQIRLSLGVYPGRVDARDGIFIPDKSSLTVKIPTSEKTSRGGALRFGVAELGEAAAFRADLDGETLVSWKEASSFSQRLMRKGGLIAPNFTRALIKNYMQFVRPVAAVESPTGRRWHDFTVNLPAEGKAARKLVLTCNSLVISSPCIFSDITFSPPAPTPPIEAPNSSKSPQNFIVVLVDTLRSDAVVAKSSPEPFQNFMGESATFSRAMSPGNMTSPSTNALLACRIPSEIRHVAFAYAVGDEAREDHYRSRVKSFPQVFSDHGYDTAMIGNISVVSEAIGVGISHGFNENISIEPEGYETGLAALEAARWIKSHRKSPFFLYVHLNSPHGPYKAPLADIWNTWPGGSAFSSLEALLKWLYRAEVNYAARSFNRILEAVDEESLRGKTNVILLADHGDQHNSRVFHGNESAPPLEGAFFDHGATLLSDEVDVPLVWRGPNVPASIHRLPVSTIGVGPAMLKQSGIPVNTCGTASRNAGADLISVLEGKDSSHQAAVFGVEGYQQRAVVFDARWEYIRAHEPTKKRLVPASGWRTFPGEVFIREELYDIKVDPEQRRNLASEVGFMELLNRARREYELFYQVTTGYELVVEAPRGEEIKIPSLGYVSSGQTRIMVPVPEKTAISGLKVYVAGKPVKIASMAWRLPVSQRHWENLPREVRGDGGLLSISHGPNAYLRRVAVNDAEVRRIVTGNPMFEKILREWGYLHDD